MAEYAEHYSRVTRYNHSEVVRQIAQQMTNADWIGDDDADHRNGEQDRTRRLVLADAVQEQGRDAEADLLRDLTKTVHHDGQTFRPGVVRYRSAAYGDGEGADEVLNHLDEHGEEEAMRYVASNYDYGSGRLYEQPTHGSSDHIFSEESSHDSHTFSWNPRLGYFSLDEQHILPAELAHHTYMLENGHTLHVPEHDLR